MPTKRSNKTARVLSLISQSPDSEPIADETKDAFSNTPAADTAPHEETAPKSRSAAKRPTKKNTGKRSSKQDTPAAESQAAPLPEANTAAESVPAAIPSAPHPIVPIMQDMHEKEQELSETIKAGLLAELEQDIPPAQDDPAPVPAAPAAEEVSSDPPDAEPVPAAPEPAPSAAQSSSSETEELYTPTGERDVRYINVLQALVEEQAPYYIERMLACSCPRCVADMKAFALTHLPSKYVVLSNAQKNAYMSVYAARYEKVLSVQMMRACIVVNENPHH